MRVVLVKGAWTEITDSLKTVQNTSSAVILVSISTVAPTGIEGIKLNPNRAMCFSPESTEKVYGYCTEDRCSVEVADPVPMVGWDGTNFQVVAVGVDGKLAITADLDASDIEIGAVELKDANTESRASIEAANTARTIATKVLATQHVDETGKVLSAGDVADIKTATEATAASLSGGLCEGALEISSIPAAAAVTAASSAVTLTKAEILNDGVHTIFYRDNGGAADVDDTPLYPGERIGLLTGTIRVICAAAETSTLRITEFV